MTATVAGIHLGPDTHANRPAAGTPPVGSLYSCTTHSLVYRTDGSTWSTFASAITGSGSVASDAIFDAKGDLAVGTGADTAAKLAVGSNDQVLTADSTQTTGLKWAAAAGATALQKAEYTRNAGADYSTTSSSFVDIDGTNLSLTITTGARRCLVGLTGGDATSTTSVLIIDLLIDGTTASNGKGMIVDSGASESSNASFVFMTDTLTAASHTFKLQWKVSAGTATLYAGGAGGGSALRFWVTEIY